MSAHWRHRLLLVVGLLWLIPARADLVETIARIKPSIVVVGVQSRSPSPHFDLRGTGFVVGDGTLVATNAHVLPEVLAPETSATLSIQFRLESGEVQFRRAGIKAIDKEHDLAVLRIEGAALPALTLGDSATVREGQPIAFTGFPIGNALGFSPVTHRGMISAITPIVLPTANARQLNPQAIKRLRDGAFHIFQLDATAYPGNSGSPVFGVDSAAVVGIINMVFVKGIKETALSQPSGISYAIPARFLAQLIQAPD